MFCHSCPRAKWRMYRKRPTSSNLLKFNLHVEHSDSLQDEALLRYYTQEWDRYKKGAQDVNRLLPILNRVWVRKKQKEGRKDIYTVDMVRIALGNKIGATQSVLVARHRAMEAELLLPRLTPPEGCFTSSDRAAATRRIH